MGKKGSVNSIVSNKKALLTVLAKTKGIVLTACQSVGISRTQFYNYVNSDEKFAARVAEIQEEAIDFVESKLMEKINGITLLGKGSSGEDEEDPTYTLPPSDTAIIFYLKTKGKKRGYVERTEVENSGTVQVDISVSKEEAQNIKAALDSEL